ATAASFSSLPTRPNCCSTRFSATRFRAASAGSTTSSADRSGGVTVARPRRLFSTRFRGPDRDALADPVDVEGEELAQRTKCERPGGVVRADPFESRLEAPHVARTRTVVADLRQRALENGGGELLLRAPDRAHRQLRGKKLSAGEKQVERVRLRWRSRARI